VDDCKYRYDEEKQTTCAPGIHTLNLSLIKGFELSYSLLTHK
jgi:hypothetical protein